MKNENKNTTEQNNVKPRLKYNNNKKRRGNNKTKKNHFYIAATFCSKNKYERGMLETDV